MEQDFDVIDEFKIQVSYKKVTVYHCQNNTETFFLGVCDSLKMQAEHEDLAGLKNVLKIAIAQIIQAEKDRIPSQSSGECSFMFEAKSAR